ncbi:MAG: DNA mismatch repair endonuclease MutL [Deltaproteobacteria bacterium]|nr:DNA mismatch repair endonuclease MutL [Deltaproteobacteria bacterium]
MNKIRILAENVASQIAAGEVVERPASVVRELLDNSIDAGARRILISVEGGGKRKIKVSDDGSGMSRDDLLLCVERHATSKIRSVSDLFAVRTLGFRGEALPSIASVSKMEITSRPGKDLAGHTFKLAGGRFLSLDETGCPPGTSVLVRDLFYNLPVRRKFLRSPRTEMEHIVDTVTRWALPFSDREFRLDSEQKRVVYFPATGDQVIRLSHLFGKKVAAALLEARENGPGLNISAYLAPPEFSRNRGDRLYVYVNQRNIRDRFVTRAVLEGYGRRLMKGQYPQGVIFIDIDPLQVDVNIHPTKQEIRFRDGRLVFRKIVTAIERTLSREFQAFVETEFSGKESFSPLFAHEPAQAEFIPARHGTTQGPGPPRDTPRDEPAIIGNLGNTYILCQAREGLLMVDQHAAHERVVYEKIRNDFGQGKVQTQALLVPLKLEFSLKEAKILAEKGSLLSRFGIELEHFGGNTFLLREVPALLSRVNWEDFLSELIPDLEKGMLQDQAAVDEMFMLMACHSAIRARHSLTHEEMSHLLRQLLEMDLPSNCPHGRPIFRYLTYAEIEKMFKRVV